MQGDAVLAYTLIHLLDLRFFKMQLSLFKDLTTRDTNCLLQLLLDDNRLFLVVQLINMARSFCILLLTRMVLLLHK